MPENKGTPGRTRTCDPLLRRQVLYPTELRAQKNKGKSKRQKVNFTFSFLLFAFCNHLVGAIGFEPTTSRSQTERTTRLCYAPISRSNSK